MRYTQAPARARAIPLQPSTAFLAVVYSIALVVVALDLLIWRP